MLSVSQISVFYNKIQALKNVPIDVKEGSITIIIGANGAGKSTLLKTIAGLVKPASGTITYKGERIDKFEADKILDLGIAMVPEGRHVFPRLSVLDNLLSGAFTRKDKSGIKDDILLMYDYFPILEQRKRQFAGTLSGGEQQMLAIGRALMSRPKLLLLDEPTLGLAPIVIKEIVNIIRKINKNGVTVMLVEQNANLALQLADYGFVLKTGTLAMSGTAEYLRGNEGIRDAYLGR
ncbi:MAG: ABC transporter ATP-binding protein [Bacillota bacterium]